MLEKKKNKKKNSEILFDCLKPICTLDYYSIRNKEYTNLVSYEKKVKIFQIE